MATTVSKRSTPAASIAKPVGGKKGSEVAKREVTPVTYLAVEAQNVEDYAIPGGDAGHVVAPSSLTPTAQWETFGQYTQGEYLGMQEQVGPNASRLYNLRLESGETVSVWGTTVLDNRMDLLRPPIGSVLTIIYVGETEAKKGQNPAKLFKVAYRA